MIRKARIEDVNAIVALIMLAMGDLPYKFTASKSKEEAFKLLKKFVVRAGNQYSISNVLVYEKEQQVIGAITAYDGALIEKLRQPFFDYLGKRFHSGSFNMDVESEAGEFYIDTLGVDPNYQGKGIGKSLVLAVIQHAKTLGHQKVALLVSATNPEAKRLYKKIGFVKVGYRYLLENTHEHLVYEIAED